MNPRGVAYHITADRSLEDQLGCFGYFGFGGGFANAIWGVARDDGGALYCNGSRCVQADACWVRHRVRVRQLFPDLARLADEISKTHRGPSYIAEFARRTGQSGESCTEPYLAVMAGNIADGAQVALTGHPQPRGSSSLSWPLVSLAAAAGEAGR